jgi:hypothetical protein
MHITASVFINDDESGLHDDYERWMARLAPHEPVSQYLHNRTGERGRTPEAPGGARWWWRSRAASSTWPVGVDLRRVRRGGKRVLVNHRRVRPDAGNVVSMPAAPPVGGVRRRCEG